MYLPQPFLQSDLPTLHDFIEAHSFGLLVSQVDGGPFASHLPLLLRRADGSQGTIVGHMARANPQWQEAAGSHVLAVFSGPHAYISPAWYEAQDVVPTWNYTAVHACGRLELIDDPAALVQIVGDYVTQYERTRAVPWRLPSAGDFVQRLVAQIIGFRIPIERLEGKWKLSQNHPRGRREKVVRSLRRLGDENSLGIAELMQAELERSLQS